MPDNDLPRRGGGAAPALQLRPSRDLPHNVEAEQLLMQAEHDAMHAADWDTLARLYMPLQEARRQRRQRLLPRQLTWRLLQKS